MDTIKLLFNYLRQYQINKYLFIYAFFSQSLVSAEGIAQLATIMPRTNSDLLQCDTMTDAKVRRFGAAVMDTLRPFWAELDEREHRAMVLKI